VRSGLAPFINRGASAIAVVAMIMLAAGKGDAKPTPAPVRHARVVDKAPMRPIVVAPASSPPSTAGTWAANLPTIDVKNRNTNAVGKIRLYADDGGIDRRELRSFMRLACSTADMPDRSNGEVAEPLDPRVIQLAFRAAYHFNSTSMVIVSATRKGAHGKHGSGDAIDFQLEGVSANALAAYVRSFPRAGVGIYTHPKTQYVHIDVRAHSYHWLDGSPPGVTWREKLLADPTQQDRDAAYVPSLDLPETAAH
jgi:uncharacterized protein YcbK (DUF882 family)